MYIHIYIYIYIYIAWLLRAVRAKPTSWGAQRGHMGPCLFYVSFVASRIVILCKTIRRF